MRTAFAWLSMLTLSFSATSTVAAQSEGKFATIQVTVVDGLGAKLQGGQVKSFQDQRSGKDFAENFQTDRRLQITATRIPFGHYKLRVAQPGFPDAERPVDVSRSATDVQVCVRTATVHIVDIGSLSIDNDLVNVLSFRSREDNFDLAKSFQKNTSERVPYGIYDLRAGKSFAREMQRRVDVFQPEVWVVLDLELSPISLPEYRAPRDTIQGTIRNINSGDEPVFVSMVSIHGTYTSDDKVAVSGSSGTFTLLGFNPRGSFLLVTTGRKGILDVRPIEVPLKEPILINLQGETK